MRMAQTVLLVLGSSLGLDRRWAVEHSALIARPHPLNRTDQTSWPWSAEKMRIYTFTRTAHCVSAETCLSYGPHFCRSQLRALLDASMLDARWWARSGESLATID